MSLLQKLKESTLASYSRDWEKLSSTFRDLDTKAQGTITSAGLFLAAALAFIDKTGYANDHLSSTLLLLLPVALIGSIVMAVLCLRVRKLPAPPSGSLEAQMVHDIDLHEQGKISEDRHIRFQNDLLRIWNTAVSNHREINQEKAEFLWSAQRFLVASALLAGATFISRLLRG